MNGQAPNALSVTLALEPFYRYRKVLLMNVSNRTRQILELLLQTNRDHTAAEIAAYIHVSSRTVHRELAAAQVILNSLGISLLKKSGSGIRLQGDEACYDALRRMLISSAEVEFSHDERQTFIMCMLLDKGEPLKLFTLAHELKVTVPTISSDLNELSEWVTNFGVTLIRKRGYGVELSGQEEGLRETIRELIKLSLDDSELIASHDQLPHHPIHRELFMLAGKEMMSEVENVLWSWEEHWAGRLSENAYTDLLIRLSIALQRINAGKQIEFQTDIIQDISLSLQEETGALHLSSLLAEHFDIDLSQAETAYIAQLLYTIRANDLQSLLPGDNLALTETVRLFISHVQNALGVDYSQDRSLRDGLFQHLKAAIQRLNEGQDIRNPLLEQIQRDYIDLFSIVRDAVTSILPDLYVPDEEIGFLVMHFGAALERLKQLSINVRAIVVCTSGIGSSKLLQIRLQKELPQIEVVDRVSWYEASRIPEDRYDLIITTVHLPIDPSQYVLVSPLLTQSETDRLRSFIRSSMPIRKPIHEQTAVLNPIHSNFEVLLSLKTAVDESVQLIEQFHVIQINNQYRELSSILLEACRYAEENGVLSEASLVVNRLVEREQSGSQMIPGTTLALFHTRSAQITKPSLSLFRMEKPLLVDTKPPSILGHFLLMLAPETLSKESLEVLSEISAMLLDNKMIEQLEAGDEEVIQNFLSIHLTDYIRTKTGSE